MNIVFALLLIVVLLAFSNWLSYREGVRDGYQNNWLLHVKKQIKDEGLESWSIVDWNDADEEE